MLFVEQSLYFEDRIIDVEKIPINILNAQFGILNLNAISTPLTESNLEFIFMIDCSGSMSDTCSDGRNKIQHITHTLKNMILYFKENSNLKVHLTVDTFNNEISRVVERTNVTNENVGTILSSIDKIIPNGSTNIELALNSINNYVEKLTIKYPHHEIINIFMTDGETTCGSCDHETLSHIVNTNITNAFIGFGIDHDTALLNAISNWDKSNYYFIDKIENSGLVYGEILHGVVYKFLDNVVLSIKDGVIYDYKNNKWVNNLSIGEIVGEANKTYHIASSTPNICEVLLSAKKVSDSSDIQITIYEHDINYDFTNYIYRQITLQLLYIVSDFLKRKKETHCDGIVGFNLNETNFKKEETDIREKLRAFITEMKQYMEDNNLNDNKFMKNLCDDIYVSYRTFRTKFGAMYNTARQSSQGTQRCYTVSHTCDDNDETEEPVYSPKSALRQFKFISGPPKLIRENNIPVLQHEVSDFDDTPYLTPNATRLMRDISKYTV
jgi:uncharacterized protein YegL/AraC-like DNA-binding protein